MSLTSLNGVTGGGLLVGTSEPWYDFITVLGGIVVRCPAHTLGS